MALGMLGLAFLLVGCASESTPEVKQPFKPSEPPPGYIEAKMKARGEQGSGPPPEARR